MNDHLVPGNLLGGEAISLNEKDTLSRGVHYLLEIPWNLSSPVLIIVLKFLNLIKTRFMGQEILKAGL